MAAIGNPAITGNAMPHDSSVWSFTVTYTAHFTDNELNAEFDDAARLWENDGGNNERRTEYTPTTRFKATSRSIDRQIPITVGTGQLSTEIGDEEIFGQIWLRRVGQAAASDERFTSNGSVTVDD